MTESLVNFLVLRKFEVAQELILRAFDASFRGDKKSLLKWVQKFEKHFDEDAKVLAVRPYFETNPSFSSVAAQSQDAFNQLVLFVCEKSGQSTIARSVVDQIAGLKLPLAVISGVDFVCKTTKDPATRLLAFELFFGWLDNLREVIVDLNYLLYLFVASIFFNSNSMVIDALRY